MHTPTPRSWPLYVWMHPFLRTSQTFRFVSSDPEAKKREWKGWLSQTQPYKTDCFTKLQHNHLVSLLMCRRLCPKRKKKAEERVLDEGESRIRRGLDVRTLIKSQDLLRTLIKMKVNKRDKRKLMRMQRANLVLEADSDYSIDSEDDITTFAQEYGQF